MIDRTSCHRFLANQFRLLLHAAVPPLGGMLLSFVRRSLAGTDLAEAQVCTLQRKLLKLGVLVRESCPLQHLWPVVLARMRA